MIRRASAVRFDRPAESGRTQPLRVAVETDDGVEHEAFLKPSAAPGMDIEGLANEALAACVAGELGLPICQPFLVDMSPEWISSIQDGGTRALLGQSCPIAFASTAAGDGWRPWAQSDTLSGTKLANALSIFAFDALIENADRRPSNPNVLTKGAAFRIIDHEMAFRLRLLLLSPKPWTPGALERLAAQDGHAFFAALKSAKALDLAPVHAAWSALTDAQLADFEVSLPGQWAVAAEAVTGALTHLRAVRDKIDNCIAEIERVLT